MKKIIVYSILLLLVFSGCSVDNPSTPKSSVGNLDFTSFVSIGNSLTQGVQSAAVWDAATENSFPSMIAEIAGVENFVQPLISDPGIGSGGKGRMVIHNLMQNGEISPVISQLETMGDLQNGTHPAPYNNLGVSGSTAWDAMNATSGTNCYAGVFGGSSNPMFDVVLRGMGTQLQQAKALNATFVTLWIGNNDILGYATSGGSRAYSPVALFTSFIDEAYAYLRDSVTTNACVANLPSVTTIPFFNTVPHKIPNPGDPTQLLDVYIQSNGSVRIATVYDKITLAAKPYIGNVDYSTGGGVAPYGFHPSNPILNSHVLDSAEVAEAESIVEQYNAVITAKADEYGFALADFNGLLHDVHTNGYKIAGLNFTTTYVSGGLFSLDGIHPSSIGYGLIANEFIRAINEKYGSSLQPVNVLELTGSELFNAKLTVQDARNIQIEPGIFDEIWKLF